MKRTVTVDYQCDNTIDVFNNSPTTHIVNNNMSNNFHAFISSRFGPATIRTVYELRRTEEKLATANNQLTFLMTCREQRLTPKGLRIRMPIESEQTQRIKIRTERAIVRERIRYTKRRRAVLSSLSEKLRDDIRTTSNSSSKTRGAAAPRTRITWRSFLRSE